MHSPKQFCRFVVVILAIFTSCDATGGESIWGAFKRGWDEEWARRKAAGDTIKIDTSSLNADIYTRNFINRGLQKVGMPAALPAPKVQRKSVWIPGKGFVDITAEAQAQVDRDFKRVSKGQRPTGSVITTPGNRHPKRSTKNVAINMIAKAVRNGSDATLAEHVDWASVRNRSLLALLQDPDRYNSREFADDYAKIITELSSIEEGQVLQQLYNDSHRKSFRWTRRKTRSESYQELQFATPSRTNGKLVYACSVHLHRVQESPTQKWLILNIRIAGSDLDLDRIYLNNISASLDSMPTLQRWIQ